MNASIQLLRHVVPAVVQLKAAVPKDHPSAAILGVERLGTGTLVSRDGLVLTVNYVVLGASSVEATLFDGTVVRAEVVGRDFETGLAVLRVPGSEHPSVPLRASADVVVGEEVFLLASVGDAGPRVNNGVVSHLGPFDAYWEYALERAILSTVVSPGVGGGPMLDVRGRMLGVVALNLNEVGRFSLAIPVENFVDHREELLLHGRRIGGTKRAWIGMYSQAVDDHVVVLGLMPGSPAQVSGLRAGDVILSVGGAAVADRQSLYRQLWKHRAGDTVTFKVFRDDQVTTVDVATTSAEEMFR